MVHEPIPLADGCPPLLPGDSCLLKTGLNTQCGEMWGNLWKIIQDSAFSPEGSGRVTNGANDPNPLSGAISMQGATDYHPNYASPPPLTPTNRLSPASIDIHPFSAEALSMPLVARPSPGLSQRDFLQRETFIYFQLS